MNDQTYIVELVQVERVYRQGTVDVPALRGLDLRVRPGELVALSGPSGSGKTTTLNLIGALDRPTSGRVELEGQNLAQLGERALSRIRRDRIGFVFQAYNLVPVLTAYENAELVLALQGVETATRRRRVMELLAEVGLGGLEARRPDELSGGQQQRVAIARALAPKPALILADEPTANLDTDNGKQVMEIMEKLNRETGVTFIFATHDPRVIKYAHRVVTLRDGLVVEDNGEGQKS
jgi:putative ABC transport system ATP-binding protein